MKTYRVVQVPMQAKPTWGVICTYSEGGEGLLAGLYTSEAEATAEADRLTALEAAENNDSDG